MKHDELTLLALAGFLALAVGACSAQPDVTPQETTTATSTPTPTVGTLTVGRAFAATKDGKPLGRVTIDNIDDHKQDQCRLVKRRPVGLAG